MKAVVSELGKRPDVILKQGSKHMRVLSTDGRQLAVISRGAQSNKGRDAKNLLANLRRNGIELEEGQVKQVSGTEGLSHPAVLSLRGEVTVALEALGVSKTRLADMIFDLQNKVVVGGPKYKNKESLRETIYRLFRKNASVSAWGADIIQAGLKAMTATPPVVEVLDEQEGTRTFRGRPVIQTVVVDGVAYSEFLEPELEEARQQIESRLRALQARRGQGSTRQFPFGKGTGREFAQEALRKAEARGFALHTTDAKKLADLLFRFVRLHSYPWAKSQEDLLWIAQWVDGQWVDGETEAPTGWRNVSPAQETVEAVPEVEQAGPEPEVEAEVVEEPIRTDEAVPLHIRAMTLMRYHSDHLDVENVVVEIMRLEHQVGLL